MSTTGTRGDPERTGFGARLREARERRNLSLRVLAERTKIPAANLDALENDQIHKVPGGIFARSFVRAYAREVGLDPEEAVRDFVRMHPEHGPPDTQDDQKGEPVETAGPGATGRTVVVIVAMAILGAAGFAGYRWLHVRGLEPRAEEAATDAPAAKRSPSAVEPSPTSAVATPGSGVAAPPPSPTSSPAPEVEAQTTAVPAPAERSPLAAVDGIRLEIHPSAPCWVRVSADGRVRIERLVQPGERPVVVAAEGIQLHVGDAGAFDYTINGQRGRPLGAPGRVMRVEIARSTVADFVAR